MRYENFRELLRAALGDVGLRFAHASSIIETVELGAGERRWEGRVDVHPEVELDPFHVSATIAFRWSPFDAARSYTCEEDLLAELVGRRASRGTKTAPRFVRVDLRLAATLPYGSTTPVPQSDLFAAWTASVSKHIGEVLTEVRERQGRVTAVLGYAGELEAECRCDAGGVLSIAGLSVSGFRLVRVPRVWDDPERRKAEQPMEREMRRLAATLRAGVDGWARGIGELAAWIRTSAPPPDARAAQPSFADDELDPSGGLDTLH